MKERDKKRRANKLYKSKKERREIITQFERQWQRQLFKFASLTHFTILNFRKQGWKHTQVKYLKLKLKNHRYVVI